MDKSPLKIVTIDGEAGSGKSHVTRKVDLELKNRGATVLRIESGSMFRALARLQQVEMGRGLPNSDLVPDLVYMAVVTVCLSLTELRESVQYLSSNQSCAIKRLPVYRQALP